MPHETILRFKQILERTKLSRSTIHRLIQSGAFPRPVKLSPHAVGFFESDIANWINSRAHGSSTGASK